MTVPSSKDRRRAYRKGHLAEWIAALWLLVHGNRIVGRRYKTRNGEVDLIARKGDLIIFVEVKARSQVDQALNAVSATSMKRISDAGEYWISQQRDYSKLSWRFDIVAVLPWQFPKHFKDVW